MGNPETSVIQESQGRFIELALRLNVLRFGEFTLKSGRRSPYFFNSGLFNTGGSAAALGRYYAATIARSGLAYDMLFGPAYKGIPLVALTAAALAERHDIDVPYAFNRKEAKDHGEGGKTIGAPIAGRVLLVDDVITAGTAIGEAVDLIRSLGGDVVGAVISLDRQEVGTNSSASAVQDVERRFGFPVRSIVTLTDLIEHLQNHTDLAQHLPALHAYRERYGVD